jgi:hypothetical protein
MAGQSLTRTREANENAEVVLTLMRRDRRVFEVLWHAGLRVTEHQHPNQNTRLSFRLEQPHLTERQRRINDLMSSDFDKTLWTIHDLARALGLDATNRGVLGKIGHDCEAIHAHSRQVARLVGSQRFRVYSLDLLDELTPAEIRENYHRETAKRRLSQPSTKA